MSNPWLQVPASNYERHMGSPEIAQLQFLARTFQEILRQYDSLSLALLGCATGNGLEYVDPQVTKQVTAVDLNPAYLLAYFAIKSPKLQYWNRGGVRRNRFKIPTQIKIGCGGYESGIDPQARKWSKRGINARVLPAKA
jgi:hypothetical protein